MSRLPYIRTGDKQLISHETGSTEIKLTIEYIETDSSDPEDNLLLNIYFLTEEREKSGVWMEFNYISEFLNYTLDDLEVGFSDRGSHINCNLCKRSLNHNITVYKLDPTDGTSGTITAHKTCMADLQREIEGLYRNIESTEKLLSHII